MIKQQARFFTQDQQKQTKRQAFLERMRKDWGSQKIWYNGPPLSIGSYIPAQKKLSVVSTPGPLLFLSQPVQVIVLEIDNDGWVRLMVGFDRRDQPVYRYASIEAVQNYAEIVQ